MAFLEILIENILRKIRILALIEQVQFNPNRFQDLLQIALKVEYGVS